MSQGENVVDHFSTLQSDPLRNFKFLVNITQKVPNVGLIGTKIGFSSVSGLAVSTESITYRTGGMNTAPQQIPGLSSFTPVTLQRGVVLGTRANWDWFRQLFSVKVGQGTGRQFRTVEPNFRAAVDIYVLEHPITKFINAENNPDDARNGVGHMAPLRFRLYNAWPSSISYSDLNAGDNALFMEQMTLVHEGFDVNWATSLASDAPRF